jgi:hypothetical protein
MTKQVVSADKCGNRPLDHRLSCRDDEVVWGIRCFIPLPGRLRHFFITMNSMTRRLPGTRSVKTRLQYGIPVRSAAIAMLEILLLDPSSARMQFTVQSCTLQCCPARCARGARAWGDAP